jgi:hypothetical protein
LYNPHRLDRILRQLRACCTFLLGAKTPSTFGNLVQCVVPLFAITGLPLNASSAWPRNTFLQLLMLGCTLWLVRQLLWTHYEVVRGVEVPNIFIGDVISFLNTVTLVMIVPNSDWTGPKPLPQPLSCGLIAIASEVC